MDWSPQQEAALRNVDDWLRRPNDQVFYLGGFAGTGKTTLARHFAEGVEDGVLFGAYTGKAALVLREKGCGDATTLHSLIYHPKDKSRVNLASLEEALVETRYELRAENPPDYDVSNHPEVRKLLKLIEAERVSLSKPTFTLNIESELRHARLLIVDECSMVDDSLGEDVLSFGAKVLVLGDPAQLPPVRGAGFFTKRDPDFMLTEIHRQARDNPIIALATQVREGERPSLGTYGESRVIRGREMDADMAQAAEQLLVGRNVTRRKWNARMRELRGFEHWWPEVDDRLVCLRNNHDVGLLNGAIWEATDVGEVDEDGDCVVLTVQPEGGGDLLTVDVHPHHLRGEELFLGWWERKEKEEFDYGYALTTHKAQGSQWRDVLINDESGVFRADWAKWLYTAITRASEKVTVVT